MRSTDGAGDQIDSLPVARVARAARRIEPEPHVTPRVQAHAETLLAGGVADHHSGCRRHAVEIVSDRCAEDDSITSGSVLDHELASAHYVRHGGPREECRHAEAR